MAAYDAVMVDIAGGIATVTLNRPDKLNALNRALCEDLIAALRMLTRADAVRVIVLTGAGRAFCAGADLNVLGAEGEALVAAGTTIAPLFRGAPPPRPAPAYGAAACAAAHRPRRRADRLRAP